MRIGMTIKKLLRKFGYDLISYHPLYETLLAPLQIATILDIGANTGAYAKEMRLLFPQAKIYSFEPLADCFAMLEKAMSADAHFTGYNFALGDSNGETVIERSSFHPSSSLLPMATLHKELYPKSAGSRKETIEVRMLDSVASSLSLSGPTLIKIDVQGFEDKVITGGTDTIRSASIVICETSFVSLYEGQPLFDDIYRALSNLGFRYYGSAARHYSKRTETLIYEDAIFIKPDLIHA
jgi:FkbM family methyltransferase